MKSKNKSVFCLMFGFDEKALDTRDRTDRDRYGAKKRKQDKFKEEWDIRRREERMLENTRPEDRLYNQWWDMTKSKFWQEFAQCDVTYHGITTIFKKEKYEERR